MPSRWIPGGITAVITEPEPAIIHFKNTRKSGFACITLLCGIVAIGTKAEAVSEFNIRSALLANATTAKN